MEIELTLFCRGRCDRRWSQPETVGQDQVQILPADVQRKHLVRRHLLRKLFAIKNKIKILQNAHKVLVQWRKEISTQFSILRMSVARPESRHEME
jgi:hypothetical protein